MNEKNVSNLAADGEVYPSHCRPNVVQRRPKGWPGVRAYGSVIASAARQAEKTGDSSTPLRMTCIAILIHERHPLRPRQTCHPEEAAQPAGGSSAGWLTKDLLRHRLIPERVLSLAESWRAARLRLHGQAEPAREKPCLRAYGLMKASATGPAE